MSDSIFIGTITHSGTYRVIAWRERGIVPDPRVVLIGDFPDREQALAAAQSTGFATVFEAGQTRERFFD